MSTSREVTDNAIKHAKERASHPAVVWGLSWDIEGLNQCTGGIHQGRMCVLVSRPSVGKTSLAGRLLISVANQFFAGDSDLAVKLFTLEMSAFQIQHRLACQMAKVPMQKIDTGFATAEQLERYIRAQQALAELPIEYFDHQMSMSDIEREVREPNTGWWVLDHVGLISDLGGAQNPYVELVRVANRLQTLAQKVKSGLVISHQNRSKQGQVDKRADLESIAGSDQIGKNADLVLALFREDVGKYVSEEERDLPKPGELLIVKNRQGAQGFGIEMLYLPKTAQWVEKGKQLETVKPEAV